MKVLVVIALAFAGVGCKQGLGDRCQTNRDCKSPLVCNLATQTCADKAGGDIDAQLPDALLIDAGVDAP